jgi:hypothetical protein
MRWPSLCYRSETMVRLDRRWISALFVVWACGGDEARSSYRPAELGDPAGGGGQGGSGGTGCGGTDNTLVACLCSRSGLVGTELECCFKIKNGDSCITDSRGRTDCPRTVPAAGTSCCWQPLGQDGGPTGDGSCAVSEAYPDRYCTYSAFPSPTFASCVNSVWVLVNLGASDSGVLLDERGPHSPADGSEAGAYPTDVVGEGAYTPYDASTE